MRRLLALTFAAAVLTPAPALAHTAVLEPSADTAPHVIPDPVAASRAVYGTVVRGEEDRWADAWTFRVSRAATIPIEVLVPELELFQPSVEVHRDGAVVAYLSPPKKPETFFEPFTLERYRRRGEAEVRVEPGAEYTVSVYAGASGGPTAGGPYVLGLGTRESFTARDWAETPVEIVRIWLGRYGQGTAPRWECVGGITLLVAGAVAYTVVRRKRRRRKDA